MSRLYQPVPLLTFILISTLGMTGHAQGSQELTFSLSEYGGSCDQPIALYRGERLTIKFPREVLVSVPSHDDVVKIFISGRLAVMSAVSLKNTRAKPTREVSRLSVTTELKGGETFICRFDVLASHLLRDAHQKVDLIRVIPADRERDRQRNAVALVAERLRALTAQERTPSIDSNADLASTDQKTNAETSTTRLGRSRSAPKLNAPLDQLLTQWRHVLRRRAIEDLLSAENLLISHPTPLRAQADLIYVTLERALVSGDDAFLRVELRNRASDDFKLHRVSYRTPKMMRPKTLWPLGTQSQIGRDLEEESIEAWVVRADGRTHRRIIKAPLEIFNNGELTFQGEGKRSVTLSLPPLDELR